MMHGQPSIKLYYRLFLLLLLLLILLNLLLVVVVVIVVVVVVVVVVVELEVIVVAVAVVVVEVYKLVYSNKAKHHDRNHLKAPRINWLYGIPWYTNWKPTKQNYIHHMYSKLSEACYVVRSKFHISNTNTIKVNYLAYFHSTLKYIIS
jgi:fatty acid desaturase